MVEPCQSPAGLAAADASIRERAAAAAGQLREARLAHLVELITIQRDALTEQVAQLNVLLAAREAVLVELRAALPPAGARVTGDPGGPGW